MRYVPQNVFRITLRLLVIGWASPWTLFGCSMGLLGPLTGGGAQRREGIIEFHGGALAWLLRRFPISPIAITFGHCVLGQTPADLDSARSHELIHVRQYERWGPLFIPAYLLCSLVLWFRGKDAYRDNPFEKEAYEKG